MTLPHDRQLAQAGTPHLGAKTEPKNQDRGRVYSPPPLDSPGSFVITEERKTDVDILHPFGQSCWTSNTSPYFLRYIETHSRRARCRSRTSVGLITLQTLRQGVFHKSVIDVQAFAMRNKRYMFKCGTPTKSSLATIAREKEGSTLYTNVCTSSGGEQMS